MNMDKVMEINGQLHSTDLLPQNPSNVKETEWFLQQVVKILIDYINKQNDRSAKILEFHHPAEMTQVFILMEKEIIRRMIELIGWPGMTSVPTLCAFTSEDSHYSIKSAAAVLGIGTDNCFIIPTDNVGRMIPEALEQKIIRCKSEGLYPFFVCATAGTTVYGAWDPLPQISEICQRHKVWMHVDAAWGGGLLLSPEHRHRLVGIERAQSVTWNPHKLMGALLQCSACFIRHEVNRLMQLTQYFTQKIKNTEGYEMVIAQPEYLNVCFWYVPPSLRQLDPKEKAARLEKVAPKIKQKMMEKGTTMVGYQPDMDKHRPNFFRMIISNQAITEADLDFLVDEIILMGKDL